MREAVAGVVPAAGAGRRLGRPKALVDYGGTLLVERAAGVLTESGCEPTLVVLGAAAEEVTRRAHLPRATLLTNPHWASGMASSLHTALDTLAGSDRYDDVTALLVLPVDMPGITVQAARRVAAHASSSALAAASYAGVRGHPVLLGREHWAGIRASATGDAGAREYLRHHEVTFVACDDIAEGFDLDHPEDLRRHNT
ncbi:nucleotidyltransferase family protein [Haloactinomyces albus]|uniref:Nicotine blue oxidoreductase n=1 Tax=Haloactinomyces albus TaxID=1352928 RepID=A0AAE4CQT3_9ACTN|nr:nucleotidyltransferase family protein [Haloactinomyces albus]MDR7303028.1 nicotine blue oxidoreductase [Haloactinomyces albus]